MGTTLKNLTDGVAAKDAAAVDQLGTGSGTVAQVHAGTKITVTGTLVDPIVNNDGVNSLAGTTEIPVTGTAHDPVVNLQNLYGSTQTIGDGVTTPITQVSYDKFGRVASVTAVGGFPTVQNPGPFIFGSNVDTVLSDGVVWSMGAALAAENDNGPGWITSCPIGPFDRIVFAVNTKTLSWIGGGLITFRVQSRATPGTGAWTNLATVTFGSNTSPDSGIAAANVSVADASEVRATVEAPFVTVTNVFKWNVFLYNQPA